MKRILESSTAVKRCKVSLNITLDHQKYYFREDEVNGHVTLETSKPLEIRSIKLRWSGRICVQIAGLIHDEKLLFREVAELDLLTDAPSEPGTRKAAVNSMDDFGLALQASAHSERWQPALVFVANKQYSFPFSFTVPVDTLLPSCSESTVNIGGIVLYTIEAILDHPEIEAYDKINVPVLQRIDTTRSHQLDPQQASISSSPSYSPTGIQSATMLVTLPKKGYVRNQAIPVTVIIKHFTTYKRSQAVTIALLRSCRVLCKNRSYRLQDSIVHSVKADVDVNADTSYSQSIGRSLLIPRSISPTVDINACMLEIVYKVRVRAQLQDRRRSADEDYSQIEINVETGAQSLAALTIDIPVVIGTLPLTEEMTPAVYLEPRFIYETVPPDDNSESSIDSNVLKRVSNILRTPRNLGGGQQKNKIRSLFGNNNLSSNVVLPKSLSTDMNSFDDNTSQSSVCSSPAATSATATDNPPSLRLSLGGDLNFAADVLSTATTQSEDGNVNADKKDKRDSTISKDHQRTDSSATRSTRSTSSNNMHIHHIFPDSDDETERRAVAETPISSLADKAAALAEARKDLLLHGQQPQMMRRKLHKPDERTDQNSSSTDDDDDEEEENLLAVLSRHERGKAKQ